MSTYTVEQISEILDVAEETVRRWLRFGVLKGKMKSRKCGYRVEWKDFKEFLETHPTYKERYKDWVKVMVKNTIRESFRKKSPKKKVKGKGA